MSSTSYKSNNEREIRKNLLLLIIINSSLLFFAIAYTTYFILTKDSPAEIKCAVKEAFGFYCPGCGGSRSLKAFLKLDFINSFILYPAIPVSAVLVLSYDIRLLLSVIKRDMRYTSNYKFYPFLLIPIVIILNYAIKNLLLYFGIDLIGDIL